MSYWSQALLSQDGDFINRVASCASVEINDKSIPPFQWAQNNIWWIAAAPGFADAYEYALNTSVEFPGRDPGVITDANILAAVQAHEAALAGP